jgi:cell division protein FtsN
MKTLISLLITALIAVAFLHGCGPSEEELREQELARQQAERDSLEQVYAEQMEQMRQDSIAQARQDSIAEAEKRSLIEYSQDGDYTVQIQSWRSKEKADRVASEWRDRGFEHAYVVQFGNEETGEVWYRVRIGRFDTEEHAYNLKAKLAEEHNTESWVSILR